MGTSCGMLGFCRHRSRDDPFTSLGPSATDAQPWLGRLLYDDCHGQQTVHDFRLAAYSLLGNDYHRCWPRYIRGH